MKKLITLITIVFFSTASFAQDSKAAAKPEMKSDVQAKHECYWMKDGAVFHCTGDHQVKMGKPVTLLGGFVVSPNGQISTESGDVTKLDNGQCITLMGSIGDCAGMHPKKADGTNKAPDHK